MNPFFEKLFGLLQLILPHHLISRAVGALARSETPWIKTTFINVFLKQFNINMQEAEVEDSDQYPTFNAFFTRALKDGMRPVCADSDAIVSPADGAISQLGRIRGSDVLQAKGQYFPCMNWSAAIRNWPANLSTVISPPCICRRRITTACTCRCPARCGK